jgi:transposase
MRFVKLTEAELKTLQEGHKNGSQFQFRNWCFCLILSSQGKSVLELTQFFEVSRVAIYSWLDAWETSGITGLMNKPGRGRKPILSAQNSKHVRSVKAAIKRNPQSVKAVVAELESKTGAEMHPEILKRSNLNLTQSAISAGRSAPLKLLRNNKTRKGRSLYLTPLLPRKSVILSKLAGNG